jgi:hypothetical protein
MDAQDSGGRLATDAIDDLRLRAPQVVVAAHPEVQAPWRIEPLEASLV